MTVKEIDLPPYTRRQEWWNMLSHAFGVIFSLVGGTFLLIKASYTGDAWRIVTSAVFMFSLLVLYTISSVYHGLYRNNGKRVLRVLDHDMVFFLIMGTYTPYCLVTLREYSPGWGYSIWGIVMVLGIVGIVLNSCNIKKFFIFSMVDYLLMGWCVIISMYPLLMSLGWWMGTFLLLMGGVSYTVGAVLYAVGKKKSPWFHTVFHFFVLLGTILMFFSIYFYVV
jgi:hemolysin III